jgi:hypothetical protein
MAKSCKASDIQVGGGHYAKYKIQPTEFIHKNNVPFIEGNIIKYVMRHRDRGGQRVNIPEIDRPDEAILKEQ